jgi:hypothetical protein
MAAMASVDFPLPLSPSTTTARPSTTTPPAWMA